LGANTVLIESNNTEKKKGWKRKARGEPVDQNINSNNNAGLNCPETLGAGIVRAREGAHDEDLEMEPVSKIASQVAMNLEDGKRTSAPLEKIAGMLSESNLVGNCDENAGNSLEDSGKKTNGMDGEVAATGPGATGKLLGATESARQEP
jgi:hypothetical protein